MRLDDERVELPKVLLPCSEVLWCDHKTSPRKKWKGRTWEANLNANTTMLAMGWISYEFA